MTKATQAVLADALRLDADARAELVAELLASLMDQRTPMQSRPGMRKSSVESRRSRLGRFDSILRESVKRRIEKDILGR